MKTFQEQEAVAVELQGIAMIGAFAFHVVIGRHRHTFAFEQAGDVAFQLFEVQTIE